MTAAAVDCSGDRDWLRKHYQLRRVGDVVWFEYHCHESHQSADAAAWYRSHQRVVVLEEASWDGQPWYEFSWQDCPTRSQRGHDACLMLYRVRFADGLEWSVFEDELLDSPAEFCRPDPPQVPSAETT